MSLKSNMLIITRFSMVFVISSLFSGCGGGGGGSTPSSVSCGNNPISNYSISWNQVNDADLVGYKVYYGTNSTLTKSNAKTTQLGNVTSWVFNPTNEGFTTCEQVLIAVTSLGSTKSESPLSLSGILTIE